LRVQLETAREVQVRTETSRQAISEPLRRAASVQKPDIMQTGQRIRPVLLTTITTMALLTPMMFGLRLNSFDGGYSIDSRTALWWKQLATAVVFGLGTATVLTLVFTPSHLAIRVWNNDSIRWLVSVLFVLGAPKQAKIAQDWVLRRSVKRIKDPEIIRNDFNVH